MVYGVEVTCLNTIDHGAEPRYPNGIVGRCGINMAELGVVDYGIEVGAIVLC